MTQSDIRLCAITDETGPHLDDFLTFATDEGLDCVEVRQIDGLNPLSLSPAQLADAARRIRAAGLPVAGLATPLFKWPPPGQSSAALGDQFGFDRAGRSDTQLFEDAIRVADAFGTRHLRIFSYLTYDGFVLDDLRRGYAGLLELAERHDKVLRLENEPVCNIARIGQLADLLDAFDTPRLEGIPDMANAYHDGERPAAADIRRVMRQSSHIHIKDFSLARHRCVPLGEGDVPTAEYLSEMLAAAPDKPLTLSIETHVPEARLAATRQSLAELRRIVSALPH
ncbi:MAG: sugar phosphate isomerase/epimerase [Hyphomicrobiaceae bacterium]|nr:sugar phosphate isomerase/epimerase [Hyphomicrobiaceae bacterium]